MDCIKFRDRVFTKINSDVYVFEPTWDSFRPARLVWNNGFEFIDFKQDLFSEFYGFRSPEEKQMCQKMLNMEMDPVEIGDPAEFWKWCGEEMTWWNDRYVVFGPCASKSKDAWKYYLNVLQSKHKTLRRSNKKRMTRRLVSK